jgi:hypothetical protein
VAGFNHNATCVVKRAVRVNDAPGALNLVSLARAPTIAAMSQVYGKAESDKRYEVVVKHYLKGVLHMAYFDDLNKADAWLKARWAELGVSGDRAALQIDYGGGIYDQHQARKRVAMLGADYVTKESGSKGA